MRHKSFKANLCPVARSLDTIGEWWSLLIVRDALGGIRRFSDFQRSLGLAKNVLSTRLKKLVACGIMEQVPASDGSAYREYALTQKGRELFPVIVALRQWGESYLFSRGEKRLQVLDKRTGKPFRVQVRNAKGEILTANDLELVTVTNCTDVYGVQPPPSARKEPTAARAEVSRVRADVRIARRPGRRHLLEGP